mgnify:CR=1 FL=1
MQNKPEPISLTPRPHTAATVIRYRLSAGTPPITLAISANVEALTGYSARLMTRTPGLWLDRVLPEQQPALLAAWQQAGSDREIHIEYSLLGADGEPRRFRDSFMRLAGPDGAHEIIGERRHLPRVDTRHVQEAPFEHILFDTLPIGLALTRMHGELVQVNPAYAHIIGRSVAETLGLSYWDVTPQAYAEQETQQLTLLNETGRYGPHEKHSILKDGNLLPARLSGLPLEYDSATFIWSSVVVIRHLRAAKEELRRFRSQLPATIDPPPETFLRPTPHGRVPWLHQPRFVMPTNMLPSAPQHMRFTPQSSPSTNGKHAPWYTPSTCSRYTRMTDAAY